MDFCHWEKHSHLSYLCTGAFNEPPTQVNSRGVNYSENCTVGNLKGQSLNTGGL